MKVLRIGGTDTNIQPWLFDLYEFKKLKTLSLFDHPILKYVILNPYHTNLAIDCTNNHLLSKIFNISKLVKTKNCPYLEDKYIGLQNVFSHQRNSDGKLIDICYQVKNYSFDYAKIKKEILNDLNMSSEDNEDTSLEDNEDTSSKNQDNNFSFANLNKSFLTPPFSKSISAFLSCPIPSIFITFPFPNRMCSTSFPATSLTVSFIDAVG